MTAKPLFLQTPFKAEQQTVNLITEPLSVSALSLALKKSVETNFASVQVKGEISGLKKASSGHIYFALKDDEAVLDAVCWRGAKKNIDPQEGMEVIVTGKVTTYPSRSKYQLVVETIEVAGQGALLKLLEDRRLKLLNEGVFDASKKKKIPFLPDVIGVITSPTGAVIQDIIHRLTERFPRPVLLWPVLVQGVDAPAQIVKAIEGFNAIPKQGMICPNGQFIARPDVLIVARGGGSLEDLWAFNEESVVRAVANSDIALISAVGHETDTTLIDFVSDLRAPTPTGAAEKAVPVRLDLLATLQNLNARLMTAISRLVNDQTNILTALGRTIPNLNQVLFEHTQKLDDQSERLNNALHIFQVQKKAHLDQQAHQLVRPDLMLSSAINAVLKMSYPLETCMKSMLDQSKNRLITADRLLESFSYQRILDRGFVLVLDEQERPVLEKKEALYHTSLTLCFSDGTLNVALQQTKPSKSLKKTKLQEKQGVLL